uniref:Secreted protein n=1 Tax=Panagrellus redivivus TaxID=6233 RepID=A0A7E4V2Y1_PANRE
MRHSRRSPTSVLFLLKGPVFVGALRRPCRQPPTGPFMPPGDPGGGPNTSVSRPGVIEGGSPRHYVEASYGRLCQNLRPPVPKPPTACAKTHGRLCH